MRLWHEELIPYLPQKQLCGQHRECCALRGLGWGKSHSVVNYVFTHPYIYLYLYHKKVMDEMKSIGYKIDSSWYFMKYRGKRIGYDDTIDLSAVLLSDNNITEWALGNSNIYPEHNREYYTECLENLKEKNIYLFGERTVYVD